MGGGSDESTHAGKEGKWYDPNTALTKYLYWSFRTSFLFLFLSSAVSFFFMICLFAGLIAWAGRNNPQCIQMPLGDFYGGDTRYKDAFSLSWTTFTTVVRIPTKDQTYLHCKYLLHMSIVTLTRIFISMCIVNFGWMMHVVRYG
jgi:hypothetical protein